MVIGEPVSECSICGLDFPESELQRHYKTGRLVDRLCADEPTASDYLEKIKRPVEKRRQAKQPVPHSANGFVPEDWAVATILAAFSGTPTIQVVGDNRAGIVTIAVGSGAIFSAQDLFRVTYGTPLSLVPSAVLLTPWDANAQLIPNSVVVKTPLAVDVLETTLATQVLRANATYAWRYEVRR